MENKYFTPDIEDLCIGYECELLMNTDVSILNPTSNAPEFKPFIFEKNKIELLIELYDSIRVPYLTKEKIEAEGWKHIGGKMLSGAEQIYNKGIFNLYYTTSNLKLQVVNDEEDWSPEVQGGVKFEGFCKDINTFKKIIKLLGI